MDKGGPTLLRRGEEAMVGRVEYTIKENKSVGYNPTLHEGE